MPFDRRLFLISAATGLGSAWLGANWSAVLAACAGARAAQASEAPPPFAFLSAEEGTELAAIAARFIPTDDSPGATEAGAVYFIDRVLSTVSADMQSVYRDGLPEFQKDFSAMFPSAGKFSAATTDQQDQFLHSVCEGGAQTRRRNRPTGGPPSFCETLRIHTVAAFLIDPESEYAGNRSAVGWQFIGREPAHAFQSPFGFYDKDYPGWSPAPGGEKTK
jgi:gluconate 2-dehydrogenase gamma chain